MYLSTGNIKLVSDKKSKFLIWSIPSGLTCPNKTALCSKHCYAKQSELQYKQVLPCRTRNLEASKRKDFKTLMAYEIEKHLNKPSWKNKQIYFRIHESGDFYSLGYLRAWLEIISKFPTIKFTAYTKSFKLVEAVKNRIPSNFQILASIWNDTSLRDLKLISNLNMRTFQIMSKKYIERTNSFVCPGSCSTCKACYSDEIKTIHCKIH